MITPSTNAPRGGLSNVEARNASRPENGADFREEVARGRERTGESAAERRRAAESAREEIADSGSRSESPREARVDDADESSTPSETTADDARESTVHADGADPAREPATVARVTEGTAKARDAGRSASLSTPSPENSPELSTPGAPPAIVRAFEQLEIVPTGTPSSSPASGAQPTSAPSSASSLAPAPAGSAPETVPADPNAPAPESLAADGFEMPRELRSAAAPESGSADHTALVRGLASVEEAAPSAPTAPVAPPRLAPPELPNFLESLQVRVDGSAGTALVELEPLDLGRLTVELSLQPDGGVRADVRAERPDGYAAVEARLPELRAALVERGFASADVQLSLGLPDRGARREPEPGLGRRGARESGLALEAERVLALAPSGAGSIDVWA